jgi:hypothetical protein
MPQQIPHFLWGKMWGAALISTRMYNNYNHLAGDCGNLPLIPSPVSSRSCSRRLDKVVVATFANLATATEGQHSCAAKKDPPRRVHPRRDAVRRRFLDTPFQVKSVMMSAQ